MLEVPLKVYRTAVMDKGRWLRLSGGCLLVLSLTALILCTRPHGAQGQTARIDEPPQPQTAPLGANVTFECRGNGDIIWVLNNSFTLELEPVREALAPLGIYTEFPSAAGFNRLFILASVGNNQTHMIRCIAEVTIFDVTQSDPVVLTVFGQPLAPTDLSVEVKSTGEFELHWTAPFTLPGENVTYTIVITNPSTSVPNGTATETEFQFQEPPGSVVCSPYTFRVFTENAVGTSESSSNSVSMTFPTGPNMVDNITTSVSLEGGPSVTLTFQTPILCVDYPPSNYTIMLVNEGNNDLQALLTASGAAMESVTLTSANGLVEDARYSVMVTAANQFGSTTSTEEFIFFTTDLQQFVVSSTSTTLDITCTLATGSSALGCNVIAVSEGDSTPFWSANLTRSGPELELTMSFLLSEVNPPSTDFSIFAMDLEDDGSIGDLQFSAMASFTPIPNGTSNVPIVVPTAIGASLLIGIAMVILILFVRHKKQQMELFEMSNNTNVIPTTRNEAYITNADFIPAARNEAYGVTQVTGGNSLNRGDATDDYVINQLVYEDPSEHHTQLGTWTCDSYEQIPDYEQQLTSGPYEEPRDYEQPQASGPNERVQDYLTIIL